MPSHYEFILRGRVDRDAIPALATLGRTEEGEFVVFSGHLAPGLGLADVLGQFAALGLGLHAVRELPDDPDDESP